MILSQKNIEEIAVAVIKDFQKSFFGSEADDPERFALPTPIDQFASDYLNLKVSFQKLSSDGSIYSLTAYVDTEYQIEVDGSQRSIFLKTNDVVLDKSFIELGNIRKLCGKRRFTLAHECAHQILFQLDADDRKVACHKRPEVRGKWFPRPENAGRSEYRNHLRKCRLKSSGQRMQSLRKSPGLSGALIADTIQSSSLRIPEDMCRPNAKACGRETVFNVLEMRRLRRLQLYYSSLNG